MTLKGLVHQHKGKMMNRIEELMEQREKELQKIAAEEERERGAALIQSAIDKIWGHGEAEYPKYDQSTITRMQEVTTILWKASVEVLSSHKLKQLEAEIRSLQQKVHVVVDEEFNDSRFWEAFHQRFPDFRCGGQDLFFTKQEWEVVTSLPGFGGGPEHAPNPFILVKYPKG